MTILDIEDVFLPTPDNLLVNLKDKMELVAELLSQLPTRYNGTFDNNSALGAALQVAYRMMTATGGRVTVFQASLPNIGPGALTAREDPSQRASVEVSHLNPANDFYKRLALECSGQQIAVDLFVVNSTYVDIATISGISRFSGGCIHHFPLFKITKTVDCESFERCFRRYLLRKIGFEAVMRIRCTRGLSIHTFHGNFFVRSTDLLSLPNINPDAGFGMQVAIEESLSDVQTVCFQAALLYTSSKGERRIRVHTMCLPVASTLQDIIHSADQQCIVGLLSKMAVDRSMQSSLSDAREAFINVAIDILTSYKMSQNLSTPISGLIAPNCLKLLPLYISALLKHTAFRTGTTTRVDDRIKAMIDMKTKPLYILIQMIYPDLYPIHDLENQQLILNAEEEQVSVPPRLHLSARSLDNKGAFLLDMGEHMVIMVLPNVSSEFLNEALGVPSYDTISDQMFEIPVLDNPRNQRLHNFVNYLNEDKPFAATIQVIRDNSPNRVLFLERLIEDRVENALSYHEFLQHLKTQVK
uniref:Protein transport protein Sec24A n=1 Tax=Anoplophora glabripennis TaxID=217634 RepID=V5GQ66_ANOGL